jgi:site-specific DNA-methyltransferase (adenine-specific)
MKNESAAIWESIDKLHKWKDNPRKNKAAIKHVAESISRFGFASPIIARAADKMIIAGHTRYEAAKELGLDKVPVRYLDLDPADSKLLALADNKTAEIADWDTEKLEQVMQEILDEGLTLEGLGWTDDELQDIVQELKDEEVKEDEVPEADEEAEPDSKPGELYELGPHRLFCGDSTDPETWEKLMQKESIKCCITDPPYGMSYHGTTFGKNGLSNDGENEWKPVLKKCISLLINKCPEVLAAICFGASRLDGYFNALEDMAFHRLLTIYKPNGMAKPWRGWIMTSEVIGLWSYGKPSWPVASDYCHDVYTFDYSERPDRSIDHPTVKPLSIISDLIKKLSLKDEIVIDPFGGSGTTLIAAAQTGRRARLVELDPKYCDVIRRRWTRYAKENNLEAGAGALDG